MSVPSARRGLHPLWPRFACLRQQGAGEGLIPLQSPESGPADGSGKALASSVRFEFVAQGMMDSLCVSGPPPPALKPSERWLHAWTYKRYCFASGRSSPVSSAKRTMSRRFLRSSFVLARAM